MMRLFLLLSLLGCVWASPTPKTPTRLSIFDDDSIPVVNQPDLGLLNDTLEPRDLGGEKRAFNLAYTLTDVFFDGRNQGNWLPFVVRGSLLVIEGIPSATQNGQNPVDIVISIGNPVNSPVAGSISYVTNRYLNPFIRASTDRTRFDFARVFTTLNTVTVSVDTSSAAANQISVFNARSGFTANVYNPAIGGFNLVFGNNGQVSGRISLIGRSHISGGQAPYRAIISGIVKQRGRTTI
ncbi:hypothetical protein B0J13DRAFT_526309 [Dactylonectria estremocensis]|uniref:Uncharacterized protein n=1 Tax=Dactylonectria estremocensis TaxID=1079267 RepID=A0A9P9ERG5_9HYPO|nr:hypothetical protein B0J13DRAFT_526309 [Dactylonectria estremocensis]